MKSSFQGSCQSRESYAGGVVQRRAIRAGISALAGLLLLAPAPFVMAQVAISPGSVASASEPKSTNVDPVDERVLAELGKRRIPGLALAVIQDGKVVKLQGYGMAHLEHDSPVTADTVFELASLTKQFTASGILRLLEAGRLALNDPIVKHLTDAPAAWKEITIRHLLSHTGGLPGLQRGFGSLVAGIDISTDAMFQAAVKDPIGFVPGAKFEYSDVGYFLLGMIIEKASGERYTDFLQREFFNPLGMTSTSVLDQWQVVKHRAAGYTLRKGQLVNIRRVWQVELPSHYGVFSSARDLAKWEIALASGKVLQESSLKQMWSSVVLNSGAAFPYGFGWEIVQSPERRVITHTGITGTEYTRYPDDNVAVIVLTNLGLRVGDDIDTVNSWGITKLVAADYLK